MKKILAIISVFALSTGIAYAMEEGDEMGMEAPAPSVTLGGSAAMGIKNEDDDSDPEAESFSLIKEYEVSFSSSGTTDGGLMFGAGISIDEAGDGADDKNGVNGANVHIGGADGTWKLQFGGNDPGIDVAGGIGVADEDDMFDGGDGNTIGLSGAFGGTSYRITMADPQSGDMSQGDGDWSAGAKHNLGDYSVGVGMDSEGGLALGLGASVSGVGVNLYYSKADESDFDLPETTSFGNDVYMMNKQVQARNDSSDLIAEPTDATSKRGIHYGSKGQALPSYGSLEYTGLGISASMSAGEGATFSVAYSTRKGETGTAADWQYKIDTDTSELLDLEDEDAATAKAIEDAANAEFSMTSEVKLIEIGFAYDLGGGAMLKASIKKEDTEKSGTLKADEGEPFAIATTDGDAQIPEVTSVSYMEDNSITTLEAKLAFTF